MKTGVPINDHEKLERKADQMGALGDPVRTKANITPIKWIATGRSRPVRTARLCTPPHRRGG
jgi:hypothetical protein